ncbi:MAG: HipA domain-containing protein [Rhodoferax sp.]|nr:HipA domain-containing protein [Rhodoferax sp.]
MPLNGSPSTHILKPPITGVDGSVFNEAFCYGAGEALEAGRGPHQHPNHRAWRSSATTCWCSVMTAAGVPGQRLHQEDFCQALGIVSEHKYQNEGGPGLPRLLPSCAAPPAQAHRTRSLLDYVVFNALMATTMPTAKLLALVHPGRCCAYTPCTTPCAPPFYPRSPKKWP